VSSAPLDVWVYSRAAIERVAAHDVPHLIVSITSALDDVAPVPTNEHTLEVLRLVFLDVPAHLPVAMTDEDADTILDAIDRHRARLARVIVHCDAGVSRSPAVAIGIARYLGVDDAELCARHRPNPHVLDTMERATERSARRAGPEA
jgi:predicted protein tyrosine phosphatase